MIRQFYGTLGASGARPDFIVTGLQDNGNVTCNVATSGEPWVKLDGGDGGWTAILDDGGVAHNVKGEAVAVVTPPDLAGAVTSAVAPITMPPPGDPGGVVGPVAEAVTQPAFRNNENLLLVAMAAKANSIYGLFTETRAEPRYRWELIGALAATETVYSLASYDGTEVIAGTGAGKIYAIDAATGTVVQQTVKLPKPSPKTQMQGGSITRIVAFNKGAMFAALLGAAETRIASPGALGLDVFLLNPLVQTYVIRRDGDVWSVTTGTGLPNEYLYGMVAVAAAETRMAHGLLVATDDAVYTSRDDGGSWLRATTGLPRRPHCADLRFASRGAHGPAIFLSTFGRSVWVAHLG